MKDYHDFLKNELKHFHGDFDAYILYLPDFFKLLCDLLNEELDKNDRRIVSSALAYFVVPNDVIPEAIYGPMGFVDDIFACVLALKKIKEKYGISILEKLWEGEEPIDDVLQYSYERSHEVLEQQNLIEAVLNYVALEL